jgi:hypothetical protein
MMPCPVLDKIYLRNNSRQWQFSILFFFFFLVFKTGFFCVDLAAGCPEICSVDRLALNSQRSICFYLPGGN